MSTELTTTEQSKGALSALASRLSIDPDRMTEVLKATVFKSCKTDEQFLALLIVSNTYGLNPLTKEIYAFPGKGGEIVPIVSIDGWLRIINDHPQMDGMSDAWSEDGSWCEVTIYRKDRTHPTVHREHLSEVKRPTEPWKQHTRRMLKWKTIIQTARIAFGFGGIHDEDEGADVAGMRSASGRVVEDDQPAANPFGKISKDPAEVVTKERPEGKLIAATLMETRTKKGTKKNGSSYTRYGFRFSLGDGEFWAGTFSKTLGSLEFADAADVLIIVEKKGDNHDLLWIEKAPAVEGGVV
jgi:phage recombination protein Bet